MCFISREPHTKEYGFFSEFNRKYVYRQGHEYNEWRDKIDW